MPSNESEPRILDHEYDGIREYDNPLPGWWMQIFIWSIVFSVLYFAYYHAGVGGLSNADAYDAEVKEATALHPALVAPSVTADVIAAVCTDQARLLAGRATFTVRCAPCHGPEGQGLVGPNLTDPFWIHGKGALTDIYRTVRTGVPEKGMISWEKQLRPAELLEVVGFVSTLRGTSPPNPKAPQGEKVDVVHD